MRVFMTDGQGGNNGQPRSDAEGVPDGTSKPLAAGIHLDDFLPYLLNRIANRLNTDLVDDLKEMGLSQQHWRILAVLATTKARTISELVVYTVTPQSTLSRMVDRMERDGLVDKSGVDGDGRYVTVRLTAAGREAFDSILPIAMRHYERSLDGFTAEERETLLRLLQKLLSNVRKSPYA
jgi:DNA-binding MarR family transcriptional regulator